VLAPPRGETAAAPHPVTPHYQELIASPYRNCSITVSNTVL